MINTVKNALIAFLLILLCVQFFFYSNQLSMRNIEISAIKSDMQEKDAQYAVNEREADRLLRKADEVQAYIKEREKKGLALIDRFTDIKTLAELIDAYQPQMDGAVSEGYGAMLAKLTQKDGLQRLIHILSEKDISVASEVSFLLFGEYVIQGNPQTVESMVRELESIDLKNMSDKQKAIVFALLEEAYSAKDRIYTRM